MELPGVELRTILNGKVREKYLLSRPQESEFDITNSSSNPITLLDANTEYCRNREWFQRLPIVHRSAVVLDLFGGIGSGQLALKRLGIPLARVIHVEHDKLATHVCRSNHDAKYVKAETSTSCGQRVSSSTTSPHFVHYDTFEEVEQRLDHVIEEYGPIDLLLASPPGLDPSRDGVHGLTGSYVVRVGSMVQNIKNHPKQKGTPLLFVVDTAQLEEEKDNREVILKSLDLQWHVTLDAQYFSPCVRRNTYFTNIPLNAFDFAGPTSETDPACCLDLEKQNNNAEERFLLPYMFYEPKMVGGKVRTLMSSKRALDSENMAVYKKVNTDPPSYQERFISAMERAALMGFTLDYLNPIEELYKAIMDILVENRLPLSQSPDGSDLSEHWRNKLDSRFYIFRGAYHGRKDAYHLDVQDDGQGSPEFYLQMYPRGSTERLTAEEYKKRLIGSARSIPVLEHVLRPLQGKFVGGIDDQPSQQPFYQFQWEKTPELPAEEASLPPPEDNTGLNAYNDLVDRAPTPDDFMDTVFAGDDVPDTFSTTDDSPNIFPNAGDVQNEMPTADESPNEAPDADVPPQEAPTANQVHPDFSNDISNSKAQEANESDAAEDHKKESIGGANSAATTTADESPNEAPAADAPPQEAPTANQVPNGARPHSSGDNSKDTTKEASANSKDTAQEPNESDAADDKKKQSTSGANSTGGTAAATPKARISWSFKLGGDKTQEANESDVAVDNKTELASGANSTGANGTASPDAVISSSIKVEGEVVFVPYQKPKSETVPQESEEKPVVKDEPSPAQPPTEDSHAHVGRKSTTVPSMDRKEDQRAQVNDKEVATKAARIDATAKQSTAQYNVTSSMSRGDPNANRPAPTQTGANQNTESGEIQHEKPATAKSHDSVANDKHQNESALHPSDMDEEESGDEDMEVDESPGTKQAVTTNRAEVESETEKEAASSISYTAEGAGERPTRVSVVKEENLEAMRKDLVNDNREVENSGHPDEASAANVTNERNEETSATIAQGYGHQKARNPNGLNRGVAVKEENGETTEKGSGDRDKEVEETGDENEGVAAASLGDKDDVQSSGQQEIATTVDALAHGIEGSVETREGRSGDDTTEVDNARDADEVAAANATNERYEVEPATGEETASIIGNYAHGTGQRKASTTNAIYEGAVLKKGNEAATGKGPGSGSTNAEDSGDTDKTTTTNATSDRNEAHSTAEQEAAAMVGARAEGATEKTALTLGVQSQTMRTETPMTKLSKKINMKKKKKTHVVKSCIQEADV